MTRMSVVAGSFYEGEPNLLRKRIENCFLSALGPGTLPEGAPGNDRRLKAVVAPHAGFIYSGMPAAHTYLRVFQDGIPDHIVILGPNHQGLGARVAVCNDNWETPLGQATFDTELGSAIVENNPNITNDCYAHGREHSIEVQLPFLQYVFGSEFRFVPISIMGPTYDLCESIAATLNDLAKEMDILVIASSDFTHFESAETARKKDNQAMEYLEFMDAKGFIDFVRGHRVSICGVGPITTAMLFAKAQGATQFKLLKYTNSGEVTGDKSSVVAYVAAEMF
ncbi:MAG: AmmeMemoRadiSam system protein B [Candidatus Thorarchaeota archaeon]|nr:AmmeMemoRadiSam system protein B [Candidatus Thorarchaeota archaeon]